MNSQSDKRHAELHPFDAWLDETRPAWRAKNQGSVHYYAMRSAWLACESFTRSAIAPNAEMVELARSKLRRSTRCPVFEMHYLAAEVLRLSGADRNNSPDGGVKETERPEDHPDYPFGKVQARDGTDV